MPCRPRKLLPALCACLALSAGTGAQSLDNQAVARIESDAVRLLLERDVAEVAEQLMTERAPAAVAPLLKRLTIFARAGQRRRVLETLNRLAEAEDLPPVSHRWVVAEAVKQVIGADDLRALRAYYERLMPVDAASAENLLRLWEREGDTRELDSWLAERARQHPEWFRWRIYWRVKLGTAGELIDELAARVRARPQDSSALALYLEANNAAGRPQNVSWLKDVLPSRTAYESYELAMLLRADAPETALKLLERSLNQPFTPDDMRLISERVIVRYQIAPRAVNWEKQLRFWTKRQLAETYRATNQPQAAQPIVEELVSMKDADDIILTEDVHALAGAVQAQSGMRVVEAKILRDEAARRERAAYWMERARYYTGRKEFDAAFATYRQALVALPAGLKERAAVAERLMLVRDFATFATYGHWNDDSKNEDARAQLKEILRREFSTAPADTDYAFGLARIIVDSEFDLDDLMASLFVKDPDLVARLLAARGVWANEERGLIEDIVCASDFTDEQKALYWSRLEPLAKTGSPSRALQLAGAMSFCRAPRRAVPLLIDYLRRIKEEPDESTAFWEEQALGSLFSAQLESGDWKAAEQLLRERAELAGGQLIYNLSRVAKAAARAGAIDDAVRLWRRKSNLDRRHLEGLTELAATKAREPLRQLYTRMKQQDPLSFVPDEALKILQ
jgi:tetratricopeptide (TPR) repeat protein